MPLNRPFLAAATALLASASTLRVPSLAAQEVVDSVTLQRLYAEEAANGQVMSIASWLTDVNGPRLTGSPGAKSAGEWAVKTMKEWGLSNVGFEYWSPKFPGWRNDRLTLQVTAPTSFAVGVAPRAWSPGTKGVVKGEAILALLTSWADTANYAGKLRSKFVLLGAAPTLSPRTKAD
ncbi:MAG: hypothetical protein ABIT38_12700, partial [Gemmatimonadaceae bacterium]